jgi:hypothetical protein
MKTKLLALVLLAGGTMFGQSRFSVGIGVGGYAPGYAVSVPPCPGPGYVWVDGGWRLNREYRIAPRYDYGRRESFHRDRDRDRDHDRR